MPVLKLNFSITDEQIFGEIKVVKCTHSLEESKRLPFPKWRNISLPISFSKKQASQTFRLDELLIEAFKSLAYRIHEWISIKVEWRAQVDKD